MRKRSDRLPDSKKIIIAAVFSAIVILAAFIVTECRIRRFSDEMGGSYCRGQLSTAVNQSVAEVLKKTGVQYSDLSCEVYDENGKFVSAQLNAGNVNILQSMIITQINQDIEKLSENEIRVSAGTLSGIWLFNGKGPEIKFRLVPAGSAQAELKSSFESAGINQTCHKISLDIKTEVRVFYPAGSETVSVNVNCILAENIISGEVPQGFMAIPHNY